MSDLLDPEKLADRLNVEFKDDCQDRLDIVYDILTQFATIMWCWIGSPVHG
jgi:hypothetical protein